MRQLIHLLVLLAAIAFLLGLVGRIAGANIIWEPVVHWRGAMGFLTFAITLILMQIRDKA